MAGGHGRTQGPPADDYMRKTKAMQLVKGTGQVQRPVVGRHLAGSAS
jgi:alkylation response protein AidB-like acyl-CoA dehydrogenase